MIFHTYKKIRQSLFTHFRRQGLKLLILTFKCSQLGVVGYYRTTREFFLVSANSSTMVLYNMWSGQEGGKENALFLQAVSISFHNEAISVRAGPVPDFTIKNHILKKKSTTSEAMERKKCGNTREGALCISFSWYHFSPSACMMQLLTGAYQMEAVLIYALAPHCEAGTWTRWYKRSKGSRERLRRHKTKACTWPLPGTPLNLSLKGAEALPIFICISILKERG